MFSSAFVSLSLLTYARWFLSPLAFCWGFMGCISGGYYKTTLNTEIEIIAISVLYWKWVRIEINSLAFTEKFNFLKLCLGLPDGSSHPRAARLFG